MKNFYTDWDEFKDAQLCNAWVATAIVGAGVLGAGATIYSSGKAADAQKQAAQTAANTSLDMYGQTKQTLSPFVAGGQDALSKLQANDYYTAPINVDAQLQDPNSTAAKAYDFTKTQGLKAVQNSAAARGLGVSGAALKGAANFTTGLADNTYTNLFNLTNTNQTNAYNRLKGVLDTGENAAAQTGTIGQGAANTAANAQIGAGNAAAAGYNAAGGAVANLSNNLGGYAAYRGLYGSNSSGNASSPYNVNNGYVPNVNGGGIVATN